MQASRAVAARITSSRAGRWRRPAARRKGPAPGGFAWPAGSIDGLAAAQVEASRPASTWRSAPRSQSWPAHVREGLVRASMSEDCIRISDRQPERPPLLLLPGERPRARKTVELFPIGPGLDLPTGHEQTRNSTRTYVNESVQILHSSRRNILILFHYPSSPSSARRFSWQSAQPPGASQPRQAAHLRIECGDAAFETQPSP